ALLRVAAFASAGVETGFRRLAAVRCAPDAGAIAGAVGAAFFGARVAVRARAHLGLIRNAGRRVVERRVVRPSATDCAPERSDSEEEPHRDKDTARGRSCENSWSETEELFGPRVAVG